MGFQLLLEHTVLSTDLQHALCPKWLQPSQESSTVTLIKGSGDKDTAESCPGIVCWCHNTYWLGIWKLHCLMSPIMWLLVNNWSLQPKSKLTKLLLLERFLAIRKLSVLCYLKLFQWQPLLSGLSTLYVVLIICYNHFWRRKFYGIFQ